jgi:hypothetical protein
MPTPGCQPCHAMQHANGSVDGTKGGDARPACTQSLAWSFYPPCTHGMHPPRRPSLTGARSPSLTTARPPLLASVHPLGDARMRAVTCMRPSTAVRHYRCVSPPHAHTHACTHAVSTLCATHPWPQHGPIRLHARSPHAANIPMRPHAPPIADRCTVPSARVQPAHSCVHPMPRA